MLNVVYSPEYLEYNFGLGHPFSPNRWEALKDLLVQMSLKAEWVEPKSATDADILSLHEVHYVEAVRSASEGFPGTHGSGFGLGTMDVPIFYGMHHAALAVCGGSLQAARSLLDESATKVLQLGGGMHHAMPARAAGFCVYNDVALCIQTLREHGKRVAYVDIDVHHGDGVQHMFYDDPDMFCISLHESGQFLFPGTGFVEERGQGAGRGSTINIPLFPHTADLGYLDALNAIVPAALRSFKPDVIVVEAGADTHYADPMAGLSLTTHGFQEVVSTLNDLSDELCGGRLISTLGGGYNFDSTLRLWAILAFTLAGQDLPPRLPALWRKTWKSERGEYATDFIHDGSTSAPTEHYAGMALSENQKTLKTLLELIQSD